MKGIVARWIGYRFWVLAVAILFSTGLRAERLEDEDLIGWIANACPRDPDLVAIARLDQVAGKAVNDWLRTGRYREAQALAIRYLDCLKRLQSTELGEEVLSSRVTMLENVLCFVPLVIVEVEQRVDRKMTSECLARCPAPQRDPPPAEQRESWGEQVRRYLHLVAASETPERILETVTAYLDSLRNAGFAEPGRRPATPGTPADATAGESEDAGPPPEAPARDERPDPVFAALVLGIAAAVASGDLDRLVTLAGGESDACSSGLLAAMGFLQAFPFGRRAALPLIEKEILRQVPPERRLEVVRSAVARFQAPSGADPAKKCVIPAALASLVLASFEAEQVDAAVAGHDTDNLALAVATAGFPGALPGSAASRLQVLRQAAQRVSQGDRGRYLCAAGDAALAAGRIADAVAAFDEAMNVLDPKDRTCALRGRLLARLAEPACDPDRLAVAACAYLAQEQDALQVYRILIDTPEPLRPRAVNVLAAPCDESPVVSEAVAEALIKLVDSNPGSEAAGVAMAAVERLGVPGGAEDQVIWGLVAARHLVQTRREKDAVRALRQAFVLATPDLPRVGEGVAALLRWFAANDHVRMLDQAVALARRSRVMDIRTLAEIAAMRGGKGDLPRARSLLRTAIREKPKTAEEWLAIADAYAKADQPDLAAAALDRVGPEASWGLEALMIKGRIEMDRKRYREAASAYTKAIDLAENDLEPLFYRGLVRLLLGDAEGAARDFEQCLALGDESHEVLGGLAYARFDQSRFEEAESVFRKAIEKDEKTADNHLGLAMSLFRQGRTAEAARAFERAAELEPAMKKGYREAERKGYVYSDIEKKTWNEMVQEFGRTQKRR